MFNIIQHRCGRFFQACGRFFQPCAIAGKGEWVLRSHPSNKSPNILDPRMHARLGPRCSSALNWPRMVFADLTHFSHDSIDSLDSTHSTRLLDSKGTKLSGLVTSCAGKVRVDGAYLRMRTNSKPLPAHHPLGHITNNTIACIRPIFRRRIISRASVFLCEVRKGSEPLSSDLNLLSPRQIKAGAASFALEVGHHGKRKTKFGAHCCISAHPYYN